MVGSEQILVSQLFELGDLAVGLSVWQAVTALPATLAALTLLNLWAPRLGLVDHPDGARKLHTRPAPLTGGLAIMAGLGLSMIFGMSLDARPVAVLALLAIVAVVHAVDDQASAGHAGLTARHRLVIDGVIAFSFIVVTGSVIDRLGTVGGVPLWSGILAVPFTILIYLAVTNAYNMVDGLDGLALSQFLIAFVGLALWHASEAEAAGLAPPALAIILACLVVLAANLGAFGGFLRCFLGDSGARTLGFLLVYVLVSDGGWLFTPPGALFFVALPLLDLCAVFGERVRAGEAPMSADRRHLHHLLSDAGLTPHRVVLVMAVVSVAFIGLHALMHAAGVGDLGIIATFLALAVGYWLARRSLVHLLQRLLAPRPVLGPAE